jgi:glycosyltransferase involved in cell wall biosynthesis
VRVAFVAPPWLTVPPQAYGGTELVLDDLCRSLRDAGHDVLLYTTGDSTCTVERAWTYESALGTAQLSSAAELCQVADAYQAARDWGAEVVHDHTVVGPFYAERHPDLRVVTTNHGPFDGDLGRLYRVMARRVRIIAISHHQASTAVDTPIAAVIHHGVDVSEIAVGDGRGGYALFLGRMSPDKGADVAALAARRAGIPLRIAAKMAEPQEHEFFVEQVEPLLGGDVEYVGEVGGHEKLRLLGDAACLLNPITWPEPFGMVMIEALARGTPVITTPLGSTPEIVDDGVTGYLCDDVDSLVGALRDVDKLDRRACRDAVETRFSATRMAADHADFYDDVIKADGAISSGRAGTSRIPRRCRPSPRTG